MLFISCIGAVDMDLILALFNFMSILNVMSLICITNSCPIRYESR